MFTFLLAMRSMFLFVILHLRRWYCLFDFLLVCIFLFSVRNDIVIVIFAHDEMTLILFVFFARILRRQRLQRLLL